MEDIFNHALYVENLNTPFQVIPDGMPPVTIELIEVGKRFSTPTQEYFSLFFRGSDEVFLPQMSYRIEHDQLGKLFLFLVPVRQVDGGFHYEAAFNRIKPKSA